MRDVLSTATGEGLAVFRRGKVRDTFDLIDAKLLSQAVDFRVLRPLSTG